MRRIRILTALVYSAVALVTFSLWLAGRLDAPPATDPVSGLLQRLDVWALRQKLRLFPAATDPGDQVVVVSFGKQAQRIFGPPPWPRDLYGELVAKLRTLGVKTIVMEPVFADPQLKQLSPGAFQSLFPDLPLTDIRIVNPFVYVDRLKIKLCEQRLALDPKEIARLDRFDAQARKLLRMVQGISRGDASQAFERTVASGGDVVLTADYSATKKPFGSSRRAVQLLLQQGLPTGPAQHSITHYEHLLAPYARLLRRGTPAGINGVNRGQPHVATRARVLLRHGGRLLPCATVRGLAHFLGGKLQLKQNQLLVAGRRVELAADGTLPLAYYDSPAFPPVVSAIAVVSEKVPRQRVAGKLAIVDVRTAATSSILQLRTPLADRAWTSDLKATLAANILQGHRGPTVRVTAPLWLTVVEGTGIVLLALAFVPLVSRLSLLRSLLAGLALLAAVAAADLALFALARLWFPVALYGLEVLALMVATVGVHYVIQRDERQRTRRAFGYYLAPTVLEHMLRSEGALRLGGTRKQLSMLFSDIRGFTSLSEQSDPEALGEALNAHLTRLTEAVFEHRGTLDKYMGDCVMAFFGAPLDDADHALHAVQAGLQMQRQLSAVQPVWQRCCGREVAIGVGVASGEAIVGNMGSERLFDYTVVGDNVNLASRLEGLTKVYGVGVLVSDTTRRLTEDRISYLEVDLVRVKGKHEPVSIHEAVCEGEPDPTRQRYDRLCRDGLAAFRARRFDEARARYAEAADLAPGARLPALYLERIAELEDRDLPGDWDGVTEFQHK